MDSVIRESPPNDGREWDCQCARCGSSCSAVDCETCGGEGYDGHECGEDTCACGDPDEPNVPCSICLGAGGWMVCISSREWCEAHPLPDRADVKRGQIEWFAL